MVANVSSPNDFTTSISSLFGLALALVLYVSVRCCFFELNLGAALCARLWLRVVCALEELVRLKAFGVDVFCLFCSAQADFGEMNLVEGARTARSL